MQGLFSLRGPNERGAFFIKFIVYGILVPTLVLLALREGMSKESAKLTAGVVHMGLMAFPIIGRLRDLERPGTHYFLLLIPLYNWYLLACLFLKPGRLEKARWRKGGSSPGDVEEPNAVWNCPQCQGANPNTAYKCSHCHYSLV